MADAIHVGAAPISCISFNCIRNAIKSAVLRFLSIFTDRGGPKLCLAASGIACGTDISSVVPLTNAHKELIHAPLQGKGYSISEATETPESRKYFH